MRRAPFILLVMAWLVAGGDPPLAAQPYPPPEIVVSGRAEGKVPADRATIHMAVTTRADTAAAAGAENARVQQRVIEALQRLGMDPKRITTAGYHVAQDWRYERGGQPKPQGHVARNTIRVEVAQLEQIGALVDAALAAGANRIDSIEFTASALTEARRSLLAIAIANARADAEAMAKAVGGSLGPLVELSTERPQQAFFPRAGVMAAPAAAAPAGVETQITPREILVEAVVFARWQFTPARQ
jgi:uncharacterized protein